MKLEELFNSTSAPASSKSFDTFSFIFSNSFFNGFGAPSTNSLASLSPNPVNSLTALTTANLEPPAALRITSNSVFSSAAPASPPAAWTATALLQLLVRFRTHL